MVCIEKHPTSPERARNPKPNACADLKPPEVPRGLDSAVFVWKIGFAVFSWNLNFGLKGSGGLSLSVWEAKRGHFFREPHLA